MNSVLSLKQIDGGQNWTVQNSGLYSDFNSVYFINHNTGWIAGSEGTILKTTDGGVNWISETAGTYTNLYSIFFVNNNLGLAVGDSGLILRTTDGGINWFPQLSPTDKNLQAVYFIDSETGFIVGLQDVILKTVNGGLTWNLNTTGSLDGFYDVYFVDVNQGWIVGRNGKIFKTTNSGLDWVYQLNPITGTGKYLRSVHFQDSNIGWIAGFSGVIFKTTNGGVTFIEDEPNSTQPNTFLLSQNYPNPFNPSTVISWQSPVGSWQTLKVFDVLGNEIATLVDEYKPAGRYEVEFYAAALPSGVYFYRIKAGSFVETKKDDTFEVIVVYTYFLNFSPVHQRGFFILNLTYS